MEKAPEPAVDWRFQAEPYFQEGPEKNARRAYDAGRCDLARQHLQSIQPSAAGRYLDAQCAYRLGRWREAAELFQGLAQTFPPLNAHALWMAARAYEAAGDLDVAQSSLASIPEESTLWLDAQFKKADLLAGEGKFLSAIKILEPLRTSAALSRAQRGEVLKKVAHWARTGRWQEAHQKALLELWVQYPNSEEAKRAEWVFRRSGFPLEARAARAERWLDFYQYSSARVEALKVLKSEALPGPNACRATYVMGKSFRLEREHAQAVPVLESVVRDCQEPSVRANALFVLASAQSLSGNPQAIQTYQAFISEFPQHPFTDDSLYYAADLAIRAGELEKAHQFLQEILERHDAGDYAPTAAFKQFWLFYEEKDWNGALEAMRSFEAFTVSPDWAHYQAQARYWEARVLAHLGQEEASKKLFAEVAQKHPGTLYATWARRRAGLPSRLTSTVELEWELGLAELEKDARFMTAVELARMKMPEARRAFAAVSLHGKSIEARAAYLQTLREFGLENVYAAVPEKMLSPLLTGPFTQSTASVFEAHRPSHMVGLLANAAAHSGVDLALVQGIVHRESGYNPAAMSPVGAVGLMQLMPDTARILARKLSTKAPSVDDLKKASVNARLGTFYLGDLIRRFDGHVELAVAAYNAGPARVSKWRKDKPDFEIDEFVETIPIKETRHYVKDVLGDRAAYRLLQWKSAVSMARNAARGG